MSDPLPEHVSEVAASLANERNLLAWQRTAMSWAAAGAVVTRYFATDGLLRPSTVVGMLMMVVGALVWLDGTRRYHRAVIAIRANAHVPVPVRAIQAVWIASVVVIATAIVVETIQ
jgi:uncharacterized membrane protein YidH (DUF202 family)